MTNQLTLNQRIRRIEQALPHAPIVRFTVRLVAGTPFFAVSLQYGTQVVHAYTTRSERVPFWMEMLTGQVEADLGIWIPTNQREEVAA